METGPIRVAIMADTHGVLRPEVERILETCDVIVHAGDFDNQMLYHKLNVDQPLYAVRGNNDRGWSGGLGQVNRFEIGGVKFIMAHERVDIPSVLKDIQVVIFGHSHMYYQQEISGRLWLNPGSCGYKRFTLPLSMAVMTIEDGTYEVETVWLEHGYGTPGAATSQREKAKASKYEKQQKRYKQKQAKSEEQADKAKGAVKAAKYGGQPAARQETVKPAQDQEKEYLFLIAKILRRRKAGESRELVIRNLGENFRLAATIYDICEKKPDSNARQILEQVLEQISFEWKRFPADETPWNIPSQQVRIKVTA